MHQRVLAPQMLQALSTGARTGGCCALVREKSTHVVASAFGFGCRQPQDEPLAAFTAVVTPLLLRRLLRSSFLLSKDHTITTQRILDLHGSVDVFYRERLGYQNPAILLLFK